MNMQKIAKISKNHKNREKNVGKSDKMGTQFFYSLAKSSPPRRHTALLSIKQYNLSIVLPFFTSQGSRKCRAGIITNVINGQTAIVKVKGLHNHPVNIQRRKPFRIHAGDRKMTSPSNDSQPLDDFDYVVIDEDAVASD